MSGPGEIIVSALLVVALLAAIGASLRYRLRMAAEVSPRHPTGAPLWWIAVPTPAALLHRRLRDAVAIIRSAVPLRRTRRAAVTHLQSMADDLERLAASADREVILASRAPFGRRVATLVQVSTLVASVEAQSARLAALAAGTDDSRDTPDEWAARMRDIERRLAAHEAGLITPSDRTNPN